MNIQNRIRHDIWGTVDKQLIWAYQGPVDPAYRQAGVGKYFYALWYLLEGGVIVETTQGKFSAEKGDCLLVPACVHTQNFKQNTELISIRFMLNGTDGGPLLAVDHPVILQGELRRLVNVSLRLSKLVETLYKVKNDQLNTTPADPETHLTLDGHFSMFLRELLRILRLKNDIGLRSIWELDPRVSACIQNIRNAPPGKLLTEKEMAQEVGISIGHLNRLFREQVGMSPHALRDNRRYDLARQRLVNQESIKEVAYSLGFSSPQHFSMWFKQRSEYTPRQFQSIAQP